MPVAKSLEARYCSADAWASVDLLPVELGRCGYEKGSDGLMIHYMTDPIIVSQAVMDDGWTVKSLLIKIATHHPRIHALIDTGALITGM